MQNIMHVLMLSWEYPPNLVGGMGKHVMDLVPALAKEGIEISLITPQLQAGPTHETLPSGVRIIRVPVPPRDDTNDSSFVMLANREMEFAAIALQRELGRRFDLIHTHDWLGAHAGVGLKRTWEIPLIATVHATERGRGRGTLLGPQSERINSLEWWMNYEAWRVIVCSQFMANQVHDYFRTPFDKIDVVPNGVYPIENPFASEKAATNFRRRYAEDDQALIYFIGRLVYEKGAQVLISAWPEVLQSYPKARLLISGVGPYLNALKARVAALDISESVVFTGFIDDVQRDKLYHVVNAAVFPSLYEAFGIVALEAMAANCPVIVSDTGGLAEVVQPHETGVTVAPDNPSSLAWGILHTLNNPDWAAARVANAARVVRDRYDWQHIAQQTSEVYRRVYQEWELVSWGKRK
jgi:glycogen(starch) synthase